MTEEIPLPPKNMVYMPAPEGFAGYYFLPDTSVPITTRQMTNYLQRSGSVPEEFDKEPLFLVEAWRLIPFVEFHLTLLSDGSEVNSESNVERLLLDKENCPASLPYIFWSLSRRLEAIRNPKSSAAPSKPTS